MYVPFYLNLYNLRVDLKAKRLIEGFTAEHSPDFLLCLLLQKYWIIKGWTSRKNTIDRYSHLFIHAMKKFHLIYKVRRYISLSTSFMGE